MNCPNCGKENNKEAKFCISCGEALTENVKKTSSKGKKFKKTFMYYLMLIVSVILRPYTTFKEKLNKFESFKTSAIMSLCVAGVVTIIKLFKSMISAVRVKSIFSNEVEWVWENLKELEYLEIIGKSLFLYLGIILVIAGVYYIASLIAKKEANFSRLVGISALSIIPVLICSLVLSPIVGLIIPNLAIPVTIIGAIYTFILLYEGINNEIPLKGDAKYYLNLVCLSVLGVAAYYLLMNTMMSSVANELDDFMKMFN